MTRPQQDATRDLHASECRFLESYNWKQCAPGRWTHPKAPNPQYSYTHRDALTLTRSDLLMYGSP